MRLARVEQAFYTDLPPRKYTFRVIASNSDGVWAETPAKLDFSVAPAYYQTNWFRALCAVFFVALLWAAYQWRVQQLHRQFEMTLDARVGERTRIARELHDTLLQGVHGVLLRFQTFPSYCRSVRWRRKTSWTAQSTRPRNPSPKVGMRCRDCAIRQLKPMIWHWR